MLCTPEFDVLFKHRNEQRLDFKIFMCTVNMDGMSASPRHQQHTMWNAKADLRAVPVSGLAHLCGMGLTEHLCLYSHLHKWRTGCLACLNTQLSSTLCLMLSFSNHNVWVGEKAQRLGIHLHTNMYPMSRTSRQIPSK